MGGKENLSPLHLASIYNYKEIVFLLLESGANLFLRNSFNRLPFSYCTNNMFLTKIFKNFEKKFLQNEV